MDIKEELPKQYFVEEQEISLLTFQPKFLALFHNVCSYHFCTKKKKGNINISLSENYNFKWPFSFGSKL